jgi:hypothetical protein
LTLTGPARRTSARERALEAHLAKARPSLGRLAAQAYHRTVRSRVSVLVVLVLVAACGGKVSGGGGGGGSSSGSSGGGSGGSSSGGGANSCLETSGSSPACIACIENDCASQLASVETACSDLLACECPGGVFSTVAAEMCSPKAEEPSCMNAVPAIDSCEEQYCESACATSGGGGGGSSSSGGSGGTSSGGGGSGSGGAPPAGCTLDDTLDCSGGAIGYSCAVGDNPETLAPSLSCSTPAVDQDGAVDFCCFSGGPWSWATCMPDDELTSTCPDPGSYGYQCVSGDDPTSLDASLACSTSTPDPDGVHDDFCCNYD